MQTEIILALGEQIEQVKLQDTKPDKADESNSNSELFDDSASETKPLIKKPIKKLFYTPNKKVSHFLNNRKSLIWFRLQFENNLVPSEFSKFAQVEYFMCS